jgi:hypothetical protein
MSVAPRFAIPSADPAQRRERNLITELIAEQAVLALLRELAAWPKPGLVSHVGLAGLAARPLHAAQRP